MSAEEFINLDNFERLSKIGQGSFGEVFIVKDKRSGNIYASKISINVLDESQKSALRNLKREVDIIAQLSHPTILKFIGYSPTNFNHEDKPVIITEYTSNGTLETILNLERKSLSHDLWNDTKKLINIYGIASAMSYLHSNNIIHRDLKPANILEDDYLFPKIADFGLSKIYHQNQESISLQSTAGIKGTPIYIPPESWEGGNYTKAGDVYAFSFIIYEILTLEKPFENFSIANFYSNVIFKGKRPDFKYPVADCFRDLITRCWSQTPENRPTFDEILEMLKTRDEFITDTVDRFEFQEYIDYIENSSISFDPSKKFKKITLSGEPQKIIEKQDGLSDEGSDQFINIKSRSNFDKLEKETQEILIELSKSKKIKIPYEKTLILFNNNSFNSSDFASVLGYFDQVSIEIKYPSGLFELIKNAVSENLRKDVKSINLVIFISEVLEVVEFPKLNFCEFSVVISPIVKSICDHAFDSRSTLTEIVIPSSVSSIGRNAFYECESLKRIEIPSSITEIKSCTFYGCKSLSEVIIPSSVTKIGEYCFFFCTSLTNIIIPSSVVEIESFGIADCISLQELIIPSSVKKIGKSCFRNGKSLKRLEISSSLNIIEEDSFCNSLLLTEIIIPSSVTIIGESAFSDCSSLVKIIIPSSVTRIHNFAFSKCTSLKDITLPSSLAYISYCVFYDCSSLAKVVFETPSALKKIGKSVFCKCSNLTNVNIPSSVTQIESDCFQNCTSLTEITIPSSVTQIGENCFQNCTSLTEITIPSSVTIIGKNCFQNCTSLKLISIPSSYKKLFLTKHLGIDKTKTKVIKY